MAAVSPLCCPLLFAAVSFFFFSPPPLFASARRPFSRGDFVRVGGFFPPHHARAGARSPVCLSVCRWYHDSVRLRLFDYVVPCCNGTWEEAKEKKLSRGMSETKTGVW